MASNKKSLSIEAYTLVVFALLFIASPTPALAVCTADVLGSNVTYDGAPADGAIVILTDVNRSTNLSTVVGPPGGWPSSAYMFSLGNLAICATPSDTLNIVATLNGSSNSTSVLFIGGVQLAPLIAISSAPVLTTINVAPLAPSIVVGTTQQFNATPLDQRGAPINATVTWNSSNATVGIIDPVSGLFSALAEGITAIIAANGTVNGTANITVTAIPVLTSIIISPSNAVLVINGTQTFAAATLDQFGASIAANITWSSSNTSVGTINSTTGLFSAIATGTTTINATSGNVSNITFVTVTPVLTAINVSSVSDTYGNTIILSGTLASGGTPVSGKLISFTLNGASVGSNTTDASGIAALAGIVLNVNSGSYAEGVNASFGGDSIYAASSGNAALTVYQRPIAVTAVTDTKVYDGTANSSGVPINTSGTLAVGDTAAWTQTFDNANVGTGKTLTPAGTVSDGNSGNNYNVTFIADATGAITARPITVTADANNKTVNTTNPALTYTITNGSLVGADSFTGNLNRTAGEAVGNYTIQQGTLALNSNYTLTFIEANFTITPIVPVLTTINVTPETISLVAGNSTAFTAAAFDQFGNATSATITWSSSNTSVGTIDPATGVFSALAAGTTTIIAANGTVNGTATATVTPAPILAAIIIIPSSTALAVNGTEQFNVSTLDQFGNPITAIVAWNSSNTTVGTIDSATRLFTALAEGTTTIIAANGTINGTATANVTVAVPPILLVSSTPVNVTAGTPTSVTFNVTDNNGSAVNGATVELNGAGIVNLNGTTDAIGIATIVVNATSVGTITVSAIAAGYTHGNATLTANAPVLVLTTITISPSAPSIVAGSTQQFNATTLDQFGAPIAANITWSSSNITVGTIDSATGLFSASAAGTTTITATSGNISNTTIATVIAAPVVNYVLNYTAGANGIVSGTSPQTVVSGSNGTAVTAVANTGYSFANWSDGSFANPRTDINVTANISVTASFIDITPPAITIISPANTVYTIASVDLNFTTSDTGSGINTSACSYELDAGASMPLTGCANATFSALAGGAHTVIVYSSDNSGNQGNATITFTVNVPVFVLLSINTTTNQTNTTIYALSPLGNVSVIIPSGTTISDSFGNVLTNVTITINSTTNASTLPALAVNEKLIGESVELEPEGLTFSPAIQLIFNYTDAMLTAAGVSDPSKLKPWFYNKTSGMWTELSPFILNTSGKYIFVNTSHFTQFAILGTATPAPTCSDGIQNQGETGVDCGGVCGACSSGSGSSGSGGGSGSSGTVTKNKLTEIFTNDAITEINVYFAKGAVDPHVETSVISKPPVNAPEFRVYQYINITKKNFNNSQIDNATIDFKVIASWILQNNFTNVFLMLYENGWQKLGTEMMGSASDYNMYRAHTNAFSYFAIVGQNAAAPIQPAPQQPDNQTNQTDRIWWPATPPAAPTGQVTGAASNTVWVAAIVILIVIVAAYVIMRRKNR